MPGPGWAQALPRRPPTSPEPMCRLRSGTPTAVALHRPAPYEIFAITRDHPSITNLGGDLPATTN